MFKYEIKKVFSRMSSKIAVLLLFMVLGVVCWFAMDVGYVNSNGEKENGFEAVRKLREEQKEWAGYLDEEKIEQVILENQRISMTPQARSNDYKQNDIAYSWKQGFQKIRDLLNYSYADDFRSYDYYKADSLKPEEASSFYVNRTKLLEKWLSGEAKYQFSDEEKEYLIQQYRELETPIKYDYMRGWTQLLEYAPTVIMVAMLILGYLVAGIFSSEFQWKSDEVFFTSVYGRNKAVAAKVKAGVCIISVVYWFVILLYSGVVLSYLGADGAGCPIQADMSGWKCFYNIQIWQKYLFTVVGGYIGCLFISLLAMFISAKTKSAVLAAMFPFILIFVPSFLENIQSPVINKIIGLMPDRLLQISVVMNYFDLYSIGGKIVGAVPILLVLYGVLTFLFLPIIYQEYRHKQIS